MNYDPTLMSRFDAVREPDESITWTGRPHFVPYLFSALPILFIGFAWGAFDLNLMRGMKASQLGFAIPFFALHLFPFWGSLLYLGYLLLSFHNVTYAISNRRLLIRGGAFAPSFKTFELKNVSNLRVSSGPIESMVRAGSVGFSYGYQAPPSSGLVRVAQPLMANFKAIDEAYDVFRQLNEQLAKAQASAQSAGA